MKRDLFFTGASPFALVPVTYYSVASRQVQSDDDDFRIKWSHRDEMSYLSYVHGGVPKNDQY